MRSLRVRRRAGWRRGVAVLALVVVAAACGSRADEAQVAEALGAGRGGGQVLTSAGRTTTASGVPGTGSGGTGPGAAVGPETGPGVVGESGGGTSPGDLTAASTTLPPEGNGGATDIGVTADSLTVANISIVGGPVQGLFKGAQEGTDAFFAYQNSLGGVYGRQLKVANQDDGFDCSNYTQLATEDMDKVFAFVGSFSLFDDCGVEPLKAHPSFPDVHVALGPANQALANNYSAAPVRNGASNGPFLYMKAKYPDALAVGSLIGDVDSAKSAWDNTRFVMESVGYKMAYERVYEPTETDFTADIVRMKTSNPPVTVLALSSADVKTMGRVLKAASQQGWHPTVALLGAAGYDQALLTSAGGPEPVEGAWLYLPSSMYLGEDRNDVPEVDLYLQWLKKAHPDARPDLFSVYGWESARLFVQALQAAGPKATRDGMIAALNQITSFNGQGMLAEGNPAGKGPGICYVMAQVHGGQFQRVDTPAGQFRCDGSYVYRQ